MNLDFQQRTIVDSLADLRCVVAGPGSGKTRVLVEAIREDQRRGTPGAKQCVLTYTNNAAAVLASRIKEAGCQAVGYCGTLHGLMLRIVGGGIVLDEAETKELLLELAEKMGYKGSRKDLLDALRFCKPAGGGDGMTKQHLAVMELHRRLRQSGAWTFDSLLIAGLETINNIPACSRSWAWARVYWDEAQDGADIDFTILAAMPAQKFVVGDPDQSIFGFRGAEPRRIAALTKRADWSAWTMERNYRCSHAVCRAASLLIAKNQSRVVEKATIPAAQNDPGDVHYVTHDSPAAEIAYIGQEVNKIGAPEEVAVICRTNKHCQAIADGLKSLGIPVQERDQREDYDPELTKVRAVLAAIQQPYNDAIAIRAMKFTASPEAAKEVQNEAALRGKSIGEVAGFAPTGCGAGKTVIEHLQECGAQRHSIQRVEQAIANLVDASPDGTWIIPELLLELAEPAPAEVRGRGVAVLTAHASKGGEWRNVFVCGLEEGNWPAKRADVTEERNLAFVAFTRAELRLWLTCCTHRPQSRGPNLPPGPMEPREPSRFIKEAGL